MKSKVIKSYTKENHSINDDVTEEIKIDEEKILKNLYINEKENLKRSCLYENNSKKLIFLVHKRSHSDYIKESKISFIETESKKIHDRNEKDNIITKIQIHYRNFLISFINEVIQKVIFEDCYISKRFDKILNLGDLRTSKRIDFVGGIRGLGELKKRVDSGEMVAAFALYPVTMRQIIDIADSGNIMPPKTTWFEPKLRSGLVIHKF